MAKIKHIIDFEIIWKKIHSSISDREEEMLNGWIKENKKHQDFFDQTMQYYTKGSDYDKNPANLKEALKNIYSNVDSSKKARKIRKFASYSSIAASIILIVGFYVFWPHEEEFPSIAESEYKIEPGTQKAQLILDDGTAYELSVNKELSIQEEKTQIYSQGASVQYTKEKPLLAKMKYNTLKVPAGSEYVLDLSDGTKIWLNSKTTIKYPVQFIGKERNVELIGEAYFEVARDEKKPFKVLTGGQVVEVLGTSFNITSYQEDSVISTTLVEGSVDVYLKDSPGEHENLQPGFQSLLHKRSNRMSQQKVDVKPFVAWKDGRFYFKEQPLEQMMKTLSRWYDVEISFANKEVKDIQFTGELERYDNFEKILALLEKTNEVDFTIDGRTIIIE